MYSSPVSPSGTGRSRSSRTCTRTSSIGPPIGTVGRGSYGAVMTDCVAKRVDSVGPYSARTTMSGHASSTRRAAAGETTSPPVLTSRPPARNSGASSVTAEEPGGQVQAGDLLLDDEAVQCVD